MEKSSFKFICILFFSLFSLSIKAQVMEDAFGRTIFVLRYTDVQGSPYFANSWIKGSVMMSNGKHYAGVDLKYDQVADELLFKNAKGEMLAFIEPVKEFKLIITDDPDSGILYFRNGFKPVDDATAKTFYLIMSDGETLLAKRITKTIIESKPYGSATMIKTFDEVQTYYVINGGLPFKIRKDKKSLLAALGGYNNELDKFIKTNQLNLKSDYDLITLMTYYNYLKCKNL